MVRVLQAIEQAGSDAGLPSRKLGEQVLGSRSYGWKILRQAEELGYITRKRVPKPEGKGGHYYVLNYLTPKGRKLLRELEEEEEEGQ
jgi:DNA-binding MarR family transcriptional regulator